MVKKIKQSGNISQKYSFKTQLKYVICDPISLMMKKHQKD